MTEKNKKWKTRSLLPSLFLSFLSLTSRQSSVSHATPTRLLPSPLPASLSLKGKGNKRPNLQEEGKKCCGYGGIALTYQKDKHVLEEERRRGLEGERKREGERERGGKGNSSRKRRKKKKKPRVTRGRTTTPHRPARCQRFRFAKTTKQAGEEDEEDAHNTTIGNRGEREERSTRSEGRSA